MTGPQPDRRPSRPATTRSRSRAWIASRPSRRRSSGGSNDPQAPRGVTAEVEVPRHGVRRVGERRRRRRRCAGRCGGLPGVPVPGPVRVPAGDGVRTRCERRRRGPRRAWPASPGSAGSRRRRSRAWATCRRGSGSCRSWWRGSRSSWPRARCSRCCASCTRSSGTPVPARSRAWRAPPGGLVLIVTFALAVSVLIGKLRGESFLLGLVAVTPVDPVPGRGVVVRVVAHAPRARRAVDRASARRGRSSGSGSRCCTS